MKLLLDENLSRRIVPALQDVYPDSSQIALLGLNEASDKDKETILGNLIVNQQQIEEAYQNDEIWCIEIY